MPAYLIDTGRSRLTVNACDAQQAIAIAVHYDHSARQTCRVLAAALTPLERQRVILQEPCADRRG